MVSKSMGVSGSWCTALRRRSARCRARDRRRRDQLDSECAWLVTNGVLPTDLVMRNRQVAESALRPWTPVFTHGDLQISHVFCDGDEVTGVLDWSEAPRATACTTSPS